MQEKDLTIIKKHWEDTTTDSLKDKNLQHVERAAIIDEIKKLKISNLADLGCGSCEDTIYFADNIEQVDAFDYSQKMINEAKEVISKSGKKNISLSKLDLLNQDIKNRYDLIITKRTLINLGNFENQKRVIQKIYNSLNENGYYVMLECSKDGLDNMNEIRKIFSLDEIPMPFHNLHFSLKMLSEFLEDYFEIVTKTYFSDYFFLTRIVAPYIDKKEPYKFDNAFKDLSSLNLIKKNVSPQFLMLLRKK